MKNLLRISVFLKPYTGQVIASLVMLLTLTGLNLFVPRIIQTVIDVGLVEGKTSSLARSALILFGLGIASAILNLLNRYLSARIASGVGYDLRNQMYNHIQYLPFTYHDHTQSGQLISRCIEDVRSIESFAGSSIAELVRFVFLSFGVLFVMFSVNLDLGDHFPAADHSANYHDYQLWDKDQRIVLCRGQCHWRCLESIAGKCDGRTSGACFRA